jgi:hypothetical protein
VTSGWFHLSWVFYNPAGIQGVNDFGTNTLWQQVFANGQRVHSVYRAGARINGLGVSGTTWVGSGTAILNAPATAQFIVGNTAHGTIGGPAVVAIDDVRVHSRFLRDEEVAFLASADCTAFAEEFIQIPPLY